MNTQLKTDLIPLDRKNNMQRDRYDFIFDTHLDREQWWTGFEQSD